MVNATTLRVRPGQPDDGPALLDIWLRSVRATHAFLGEADIQDLLPLVGEALPQLQLWVLTAGDAAVGFIGLSGYKIEALFLAPELRRCGGGRMLVEHARSLAGALLVDVNEQNPDARRFYEAMGFVVAGRSELDGQGRPFPLLHMRAAAPRPTLTQTRGVGTR